VALAAKRKSAIDLDYDKRQVAGMKLHPVLSIFSLAMASALMAQDGNVQSNQPPPDAAKPSISQRAYQGIESNIRVDERSAYAEPESVTPPYYPKALRDAGIKGTVVVELEVDRNNAVLSPRVVSSPHPELNLLAIEAVLSWKYASAVVNGAMARSRIEVEVDFDPASAEEGSKKRRAKLSGKPDRDLPEEYQYDEAPDLVRTFKAVYPYDQLMDAQTGNATVTFIVDPHGNARGAEVKDASDPEFGAATAAMVEAWVFEPAMKNGKPCWALITKKQVFNRINPDSPIDKNLGELVDDLRAGRAVVYNFGEVDRRPEAIFQVGPELPESVRKSGQGASAKIEFIIDESGRAVLPRIVSSTNEAFGWAAATAISRWVFSPAEKDGKPALVRVQVPINYEPPK